MVNIAGLSKTFPGQRALDDFSLTLRRGEIHALVGENGSGKSTLIKCLSGYHLPDAGASFAVGGAAMSMPYTAAQAAERGLVFVHQYFGIVPGLTVMENVALGSGFATRQGRIDWKSQAARTTSALAILGREDIAPAAKAGDLPVSSRAIIAIARALASAGAGDGANLLVLDEPTAALPQAEVDVLFGAVRSLARAGTAVLFVSHRLPEVFELADRVTVLRDSRVVARYDIDDVDERTLVSAIVGRDLGAMYPSSTPRVRSDVALEVRGLSGSRVRDVTMTASRGEIVGVAGLQGSGRSELLRLLFGAQAATNGEIRLRDRTVKFTSPVRAIEAGVALVPEHRVEQGIFLGQSLSENVLLTTVRRYWSGLRIDRRRERVRVRELIDKFDIRPAKPGQAMSRLSGGNQQKAVLAKWIETSPVLLLLDEPTQGVDVGSKSDIYRLVEEWVEESGSTVVMVSSDFEELSALCHRVLVMRDGRVAAQMDGPHVPVERIVESAYFGSAP